MKLFTSLKRWLIFKFYQEDLLEMANRDIKGEALSAFRRFVNVTLPEIHKKNGMNACTQAIADYINFMDAMEFDLTITANGYGNSAFTDMLVYLQKNFLVNQCTRLGPVWFFRIVGKRDDILNAMKISGRKYLLEITKRENIPSNAQRHPGVSPLESPDPIGAPC